MTEDGGRMTEDGGRRTEDIRLRRGYGGQELCASSSANRFGDSCVGFLADLLVESLACLVVREHPAPPGGGRRAASN